MREEYQLLKALSSRPPLTNYRKTARSLRSGRKTKKMYKPFYSRKRTR